jgi:hypothetical protein
LPAVAEVLPAPDGGGHRRTCERIPATAVQAMWPGSVIVDLAAELGDNCELTAPGEEVVREGFDRQADSSGQDAVVTVETP